MPGPLIRHCRSRAARIRALKVRRGLRLRRPSHVGAAVIRRPWRGPHQLRPALYVAGDLRWFEAAAMEAMTLAERLVQVDADGVERTYARIVGPLWRELVNRHGHGVLADIRARLVEIHGDELVLQSESAAPRRRAA